jgi:DNA-directed RNA polymerase specialized sigma24 family protein
MAKPQDDTTWGGPGREFPATKWSEIRQAKLSDEAQRQSVANTLIRKYWKPVYCYLRRKGHDNESAKDLTQGFFYEIVLGRDLIQYADQAKGRFRTFLLTALDRYVASEYRRETAQKRLPVNGMAKLDAAVLPDIPAGHSATTPESIFHYAWAADLLDQTLSAVKREYFETGKAVYWEVFRAKLFAPILDNTEAPSLRTLCKEYGIEDEVKASNMIITVKRRLNTVLKRVLRQYVQSDSEVEEEFSELLQILSTGSAG